MDQSAISRIESPERYVMDFGAVAIAEALKNPLEWLFDRS